MSLTANSNTSLVSFLEYRWCNVLLLFDLFDRFGIVDRTFRFDIGWPFHAEKGDLVTDKFVCFPFMSPLGDGYFYLSFRKGYPIVTSMIP